MVSGNYREQETGLESESMSLERMPLISIITPCLNRAQFIEKAIRSVLNQNYSNIEHIIVDGGSTDGTLDILKKYPHLRVIIEEDQEGVYGALNKGIKIAQGAIIGQLNSDDYYQSNVFSRVVQLFNTNPEIHAVIGAARVFSVSDSIERTIIIHQAIEQTDILNRLTLGTSIINAWFFRTCVFKQLGFYNLAYKIAADQEFLLRFYLRKYKFKSLRNIVYHYCYHSDSLTFSGEGKKSIDIAKESLLIANSFLKHRGYSRNLHKHFLDWHTTKSIDLAILSLLKFNFPKFISYMIRGTRYNIFWFFIFLRKIIVTLFRRIMALINYNN